MKWGEISGTVHDQSLSSTGESLLLAGIKKRYIYQCCCSLNIFCEFYFLSSYRPMRRNICLTAQVICPCSVACRVSSPLTAVGTDFGGHCCSQNVKFMPKKSQEIKSQPLFGLFSVTVSKSFRNLNYLHQIPNKISHISIQFCTSS